MYILCIKEFIETKIISEIKQQSVDPYYGIQCDEVRDSSNWGQLGCVIRYVKRHMPCEKLLEFMPCETTTCEALCQSAVKCLTDSGLDIKLCRSQTLDGTGSMARKHAGFASHFFKLSPQASYNYCSNHDLNLALCKGCEVKEVHAVNVRHIETIRHIFRYSLKRSRRLEAAVDV